MITVTQLLLFSGASLVLIFTPGPDIIYVMTRGIAQGRKAALAAAAGFSLGNIGHTLFAVFGLSALLASSEWAFQIVKYVGAAYLVYLGFQLFRAQGETFSAEESPSLQEWTLFRQSLIANILNPKVAIFFLAFFPQFVVEAQGQMQLQMLVLGLTFVGLSFIGFSLVGLAAGTLGGWLNQSPQRSQRIGQIAGGVLILLGVRLALGELG